MSEIFNWRAYLKVHPAADLFPLLPPDELHPLADDIKANGLHQSVVLDANLNLLDGRNRLDALASLGLLEAMPNGHGIRIKGETHPLTALCYDNGDPYDIVLSLNVHRRHLTAEQKRELIAKVLKAKPEQSNRAIAKQVKADDKTVAAVRRDLESTAEIPQLKKTVGADGKARKMPALRRNPRAFRKLLGAEEPPDEDHRGFIVAVIKNATEKANIAIRNLNHEFANSDSEEIIEAIDALARKWEGVKRKVRVKEAPDERAPKAVDAKDTALESFDAHALELIRLMKGQKPQRFARTAVPRPLLGDLVRYLRELVAVCKLAGDPAASAEERKATYAADEGTP